MTPQEFMDKWGLTKKDLAIALDLSLAQVERWFFKPESSNYQDPQARHLKRLKELDFIFETLDLAESSLNRCPEHIKSIQRTRKNIS